MIQAELPVNNEPATVMTAIAINEAALLGLAPPLNTTESAFLAAMMHPSSKLSALIPANTKQAELLTNLEVCCRAAVWADKTIRKINPIIGRILLVIKDTPEAYKSQGFEKFGDFVTGHVFKKLGYSRSASYESMRLVETHPNLPVEKWMSIGVDRLGILAKFTKEGEPSYQKYLAKAEQAETTSDFKAWAYEKGHLQKGELDRATVIIECNKLLGQQWKDFRSDPRVQATAGGSTDELIFSAMIAECSTFLTEDGHRPQPQFEVTDVAFIWRCEKCSHSGIIPSMYPGSSMNDLRNYVYDAHHETATDCDENIGDITFIKADAQQEVDNQEAPIE